jgi:5-formyltetrahydrofolate cyclo-ligase
MHERKRPARSELIAARAKLTLDDRDRGSAAIAHRVETIPGFLEAKVLAVYAAIGTEVDVAEIARRAAARGVRVAYPRVVRGDRKLAYAEARPDRLVPGPLGTLEPPAGSREVARGELECAIVPGVGFSRDGHRLGRGGGHYDATLAEMPRALRIGVGFEVQIVPELPHEPHDQPLDAVATELQVFLFPRAARGTHDGSAR